jgi:hypothetical protein
MTDVGFTALSVEINTNFFTLASIAAKQQLYVPTTLFLSPHRDTLPLKVHACGLLHEKLRPV